MQKKTSFSDLCNLEARMFNYIIYQLITMLMDGHKSQMHVNFAICTIPSCRSEICSHSVRQSLNDFNQMGQSIMSNHKK